MEMISEYFAKVNGACKNVSEYEIRKLLEILERVYYQRRNIFIFGNGGSGATASHFCEDLAKGTLNGNINQDGIRFKAMSLTDNVPFILALANDEGYHAIFEQQLRNYSEPGDIIIAISGSGNSPNVINAVKYANRKKLITIGMTGFDGGELKKIARYCVHVPIHDMGVTESVHGIIIHYVVELLKEKLNNNYRYLEKVTSVLDEEVEKNRLTKEETII